MVSRRCAPQTLHRPVRALTMHAPPLRIHATSGIIARKLSCTSLSLGLPSTFLDPMGALHGDLGMLNGAAPGSAFASMRSTSQLPPPPCDVLIALSHSGSSGELIAMLPHVKLRGVKVIALTAKKDSALGQAALESGGCWIDCRTAGRGGWPETPGSCSRADSFSEGSSFAAEQQYGFPPCSSQQVRPPQQSGSDDAAASGPYCAAARFVSALTAPPAGGTDEADPDLPAPTSSTTTALAMGDSLVLSCARLLGLGTGEFGKNHPGGALGKRMMAELQQAEVDVKVDVEVAVRKEESGVAAPAPAAAVAVNA